MQTSGSMENIFSIAKPPHFLQMHTGDLDYDKIEEFAKSQESITHYELVEMINIDGANIWYEKNGGDEIPMADSMLDNGFVKQTTNFDYLLDLENNIVEAKDGEIGVPITYMQKYDMAIGDSITIKAGDYVKTFTVKYFLRDAQMASSMASSVRFLLSNSDFLELKAKIGEPEYIVEFLLEDSKLATDVKKIYEESGLPANGQGITYPLIKLINSLSSGLLAGAMILVSIILILIAALNLYFTILAVLEEEIREIGAMKAIGISNKDIKKLYMKKYRVLAVVGCAIGFVLGMISNPVFTKNIRLMLGDRKLGLKGVLVAAVSVLFVYWFMMLLCKKILKRIGNITVVQALVYGETGTRKKEKEQKILGLEKYCSKNVNLFYSFRSLIQKRKSWLLIVVVFFLATNVMLIPMNLIHTVQDKKFANSMGNADCDIWMEMQSKDNMEENCENLVAALKNDNRIKNFGVYFSNKGEALGEDGVEPLQVHWGEYSEFPIHCMDGNSPQKEGEIALSYLNSKKLGKKVGDTLKVTIESQAREYTVVGIYQDITSGGYTAKAYYSGEKGMALSYTIFANCEENIDIANIAKEYAKNYSFAKILPAEEFTAQTFGSITDSFGNAAYVSIVVALFIGILITVLFLKLQSAKEFSELATLRVLGFSLSDLIKQYMIKGSIASFIGIVLGMIWCNTACEKVVGLVLAAANTGIADFNFHVSPFFNFVLCPLLMLVIALITTYMCARGIKRNRHGC